MQCGRKAEGERESQTPTECNAKGGLNPLNIYLFIKFYFSFLIYLTERQERGNTSKKSVKGKSRLSVEQGARGGLL